MHGTLSEAAQKITIVMHEIPDLLTCSHRAQNTSLVSDLEAPQNFRSTISFSRPPQAVPT